MEIGKRYYDKLKQNKKYNFTGFKKIIFKKYFWVFGILLKKDYKKKEN